jgi:hypothetical protein
MPSYLDPERVRLELVGGVPTITLSDATLTVPSGWSVLNRQTLVVVDGPGDEGFLLRRLDGEQGDLAPDGWDAAVAERGTVDVVASGVRVVASVVD